MIDLKVPKALKEGDTVALLSLSSGLAGEKAMRTRYEQGKKYLEEVLKLKVIEGRYSLKGLEFIEKHPELRAEDLMNALRNPEVKAIVSNIGGNDSHKVAAYVDRNVISNNPKIFIGFSDATSIHYLFYKNGVQSYYGPALLTTFAENCGMNEYTLYYLKQALFNNREFKIEPSNAWTSEYLEWTIAENNTKPRKMNKNLGYTIINKTAETIEGNIYGGCIESIDRLIELEMFPKPGQFQDAIIFLETAENQTKPHEYSKMIERLSKYIRQAKAIILGRPYHNTYFKEYLDIIAKFNKPTIANFDIGHTDPMVTIPIGAKIRIDFDNNEITIKK